MSLTLGSVVRIISVVRLSGVKKFWVASSGFNCNWVSMTPVVDVVGFWLFCPHCLYVSAFVLFPHRIPRWMAVQ
jgi:hypothetical protein